MTTGPDQNPKLDEQLSAWLDDELPAAEVELLAARLARSREHRGRAARYSLIGATLRGYQSGLTPASLAALQVSERVSAALERIVDRPQVADAPHAPRGRTGSLVPYGVAAGVVLVTLALVPLLRPASGPQPEAQVVRQAPAGPVAREILPPHSRVSERVGGGDQGSLSPGRLTNYLVYHGEYSGMLSTKLTDSHIVNNRSYAVALHAAGQPSAR